MIKHKLFLLVLFLVSFLKVDASHISGGDISYECVGQDSFLVTVNLFRDCAGVVIPNSINTTFASTCGSTATATFVQQSSSEVSMLCPSQLANSTCNGGTWPGVEMVTFSGIVVLSVPCNTWTMEWSSCCRNAQVSNLVNPGGANTYLFATLNSGVDSCQSSPYFTSIPAPYVCLNTQVDYNMGVVDPEGDSIVYALSPGFEDATTLVNYGGNYTFLQPLPGSNLILDQTTGQITFTPTATGVYVLVVRVEKYDRVTGTLKGTIMRDLQIVVQNCVNDIPKVDSPGIYNVTGATVIDSNSISACLGANINFDISISDTNLLDTINILHNIYDALDSTAIVTITPGNPAVINVSWWPLNVDKSFYSFAITALDDACPVRGMMVSSFDIRINPATYAGEDVTICAGDSVELQGNGGTSFVWSVISGTPMASSSSCFQCASPTVYPSANTTYLLVSNTSGTCSNLDTVVVNVAPTMALDLPNDSTICEGDSIPVSVLVTPSGGAYTYSWQASPSLSNVLISNPIATPGSSEIFTVSVSNSQGCTKVGGFTLNLAKALPNSFSINGDSIICLGDSVDLLIDFPSIISTSCGVVSVPIAGPLNQGVIGQGNSMTTSTSFPSVYGRFYWGVKHQIIYTRSELLQMGMLSGSVIKSIGFNVASVGTPANMDQLTVRIGCTNDTMFTGNYLTGLQTVVQSHQYFPVLGWNTHSFFQDYIWDGQSNIVVELCSNNNNYSSASTSNTYFTPTANNTVAYYRADNATVCSGTNLTTSTDRPNTQFEFITIVDSTLYNYSWSPTPAQTNTLGYQIKDAPLVNTLYTVTISDSVGVCTRVLSQNVQVKTDPFDAGFVFDSVICENDTTIQLLPIINGGIFTGTGVTTDGYFNPIQAGSGNWPINYNIPSPALCSNDSTIMVPVIGLPDVTVVDQELCLNNGVFNLQAATSGGIWSGFMVTDSVNGIADNTGFAAGSYEVYYEINTPCYNSDTGIIQVVEPYSFLLVQPIANVCDNETIDLNNEVILSGNPLQGSSPHWSFANPDGFVNSNGVFDAVPAIIGQYLVDISVADSNGLCGTTQNLQVNVNPVDRVIMPNSLSFCENEVQGIIFASPWLYGAGVTFTQRPLGNLGVNDTLSIYPYGQFGEFNASLVGVGSWEITITYENVYGCIGTTIDTIYVLDPPTAGVSNMGNYLTATAGLGYDYQWLDCDNGNLPIAGATSATYVPGVKGRFAVEIKAGNCMAISDCYETWPVGGNDFKINEGVNIHPNPTQNQLTVTISVKEPVVIEILDNSGKLVLVEETDNLETSFSLENLVSGVYIIRVQGETILYTEKLIKH